MKDQGRSFLISRSEFMTIRACITTDYKGNITIQMRGGLDYETTLPLKQEIQTLLTGNPCSNVILDMEMVEFVGSSGIGQFVETICEINKVRVINRVTLKNVSSDFIRVFKLYNQGDLAQIEKYIENFNLDEEDTRELNVVHGGRKRTFQN